MLVDCSLALLSFRTFWHLMCNARVRWWKIFFTKAGARFDPVIVLGRLVLLYAEVVVSFVVSFCKQHHVFEFHFEWKYRSEGPQRHWSCYSFFFCRGGFSVLIFTLTFCCWRYWPQCWWRCFEHSSTGRTLQYFRIKLLGAFTSYLLKTSRAFWSWRGHITARRKDLSG